MNKQVVQSVEISAIAHATDSLDKIQTAINALLPGSLKGRQLFTRRYLEGHYRNPIVTFEARLTKPGEIEEFTDSFIHRLPRDERLRIQRDLALHSDTEGNLYIRINKQQAFRGILELGDEDPIRVKLKFSRLGVNAAESMKIVLESE